MYVFFLVDWYGVAFALMVIGVLESLVFCWIYGKQLNMIKYDLKLIVVQTWLAVYGWLWRRYDWLFVAVCCADMICSFGRLLLTCYGWFWCSFCQCRLSTTGIKCGRYGWISTKYNVQDRLAISYPYHFCCKCCFIFINSHNFIDYDKAQTSYILLNQMKFTKVYFANKYLACPYIMYLYLLEVFVF